MKDATGKRILTGIKPTGTPHLGNMVGALLPVIQMAQNAKDSVVFIADLHALNAKIDPVELQQSTKEIAAAMLALGLDPEKTTFFRQGDVPELGMFNTLLSNVTPKALLNQAHAYKAITAKNIQEEKSPDDGVNMGLYDYPKLMASDILLYNADLVPVGKDQTQHLEIARDIAGALNHKCKTHVTMPNAVIEEETAILPGLDGQKMSKSYRNTIPIFGSAEALKKAVMSIKTDARLPSEPKPDADDIIIYQIYKAIAPLNEALAMRQGFIEGKLSYGDAKKTLLTALETRLAEPRKKYEELMQNDAYLEEILQKGAAKARVMAAENLTAVSQAMLGRPLSIPGPVVANGFAARQDGRRAGGGGHSWPPQ